MKISLRKTIQCLLILNELLSTLENTIKWQSLVKNCIVHGTIKPTTLETIL